MNDFEITEDVVKHMRATAKRIIQVYHLDNGDFDDLMQEMKVESWKALQNYVEKPDAKLSTFLKRVIDTYALRRGSLEKQRQARGLCFLSLDAHLENETNEADTQIEPHDYIEDIARRDDYRLLRLALLMQKETYRKMGEVCLTKNLFAKELADYLGIKYSVFKVWTWPQFLRHMRETMNTLLTQTKKGTQQ